MKALNAASLTPLSVLSQSRTIKEPRKLLSNPTCKVSNFTSLNKNPQTIRGGLALLSSILSTKVANALTYEEALQQSVTSPSSSTITDFDESGVLDSFIGFATENPLVVAAGVAVFAVPLIVSQIFKESKSWGVESAKKAYALLGEDGNSQLLDIRAPAEIRQVGSPDLSGLRKKAVSVVYRSEDKSGFLKRLSLKFKEPENTTLFILDKFNGNSELVAELVTVNGFKAAYAIKDGAEGPRGWIKSGLPWLEPKKALILDLSSLTDGISSALGEGFDALAVALGVAAATGFGLFAFTEVETILQLLGSAAIIQLVSKKLLFAEDRKQTLKQVDEFLNTKIAPKDLGDEIKQIGKALLPSTTSGKALPAPAEENPDPGITNSPVQKAEAAPELSAELKPEAAVEPTPQINSVPKTEVKTESVSTGPRPLSPFPSYPDFKPPTSPTPSQP